MFDKILIANRGEIALRIHRACREMGVATVAVHSTADNDAMHVRLADESVCIGPAPARDSYLNIPAIISACDLTGANAVHPGYGFLSENTTFARIVEEHGLVFIGPSPEHIALMGDKAAARVAAQDAGLACVPGSDGPVTEEGEARRIAAEIGYPILIKASAGGGGRGMKRVHAEAQLAEALASASSEAAAAFGDGSVYIEKLLINPRHIEIQILADTNGNTIHLGERDCSLQRRHQKILEEAPSPALNACVRAELGAAAARVAERIGYRGVGTMEFLHTDGSFYFIEMNTRLQVEHPITEEVYGVDIVREQIRIANGAPLSVSQSEAVPQGHAIECRINAEHPTTFAPSPGRIEQYHVPGGLGVRMDSAVYTGSRIPPDYDSLIGKLVIHGRNREECLMRLRGALSEIVLEGVDNTVPLFRDILRQPSFINGTYHTGSLEAWLAGDTADADHG